MRAVQQRHMARETLHLATTPRHRFKMFATGGRRKPGMCAPSHLGGSRLFRKHASVYGENTPRNHKHIPNTIPYIARHHTCSMHTQVQKTVRRKKHTTRSTWKIDVHVPVCPSGEATPATSSRPRPHPPETTRIRGLLAAAAGAAGPRRKMSLGCCWWCCCCLPRRWPTAATGRT